MDALWGARRAEVIVRRARHIYAMPSPANHEELVLRADMLRMMRDSVEIYIPPDLRPQVWRALNNDEPGDDESRASRDYEGSYEDWDDLERALEDQNEENQRGVEEEKEDEEMTEPDDQKNNPSSSDDDNDEPPSAPGATGGNSGHGYEGSGHEDSGSSDQNGGSDAPGRTTSTGHPGTTGSDQALDFSPDADQSFPELDDLLLETPHRQGELEADVAEHRDREAEELGVEGIMRDREARTRLDSMTRLPDAARDFFRGILRLPRSRVRFDAIVGRIRTLRRLPPFRDPGLPYVDPAVVELNTLREMIPDILPDALAEDAMEIINEEDVPASGPVDYHFGDNIQLRALEEDLTPVVFTDEDIQRNETQRIRFMLSLPTEEERERDILRRAREVRGHFIRQQELRGRFPDAEPNKEWRRWLLEWHVWNDDVSTLVPESDLWFRIDRILVGADSDIDQEIMAERRDYEASEIIVRLEESLPDYAFPDDDIPVRMAALFRRIVLARTADARARMMINRAYQLRRMETPPRDDPRGVEMTILRRMAPWLLSPRLMDIVMPVLRGEVEESDVPDLTCTSDNEMDSPRRRGAETPEVVEDDNTELDNHSHPEPRSEDSSMSPEQTVQPVAPVADMGYTPATQTPPAAHLPSTAATLTTTTTTTSTTTHIATATTTLTGRDPAEVAAAALGIDLNGPRLPPPEIEPMVEYDSFRMREQDRISEHDGRNEWSDAEEWEGDEDDDGSDGIE